MTYEHKSQSRLKRPPLRVPGQSLDAHIQRTIDNAALLWILAPLLLWVLAAYEWLAMARGLERHPGAFVIAALALSVVGVSRIRRARTKLKALRLGLAGERLVGQMLDELRIDGTRILHDLQGDDFNVDHLVISPRGICCVETKTYSKPHPDAKVHFDGHRVRLDGYALDRDPIKQVVSTARWLEGLIAESTGKRFSVRPVVVFPHWYVKSAPGAYESGIWVLEPKALLKWIENEPVTIGEANVALISYQLGQIVRAGERRELGL